MFLEGEQCDVTSNTLIETHCPFPCLRFNVKLTEEVHMNDNVVCVSAG